MPVQFQVADGKTYHTRIGAVVDIVDSIIKDYFNEGDVYGTVDGIFSIMEIPLLLPICYAGSFGKTGFKKIEVE